MARNLNVAFTEEQPYYFISYNSEDEGRVSEFARELEKLNVPMWYDHGIRVGQEWETEIAEKIKNCEAVMMFLSKKIFLKEKSYVHTEFRMATEYSKKNVYIVMLDDIKKEKVPTKFQAWWIRVTSLQCINAYDYNSPAESMEALVKALNLKTIARKDDVQSENASSKNKPLDETVKNADEQIKAVFKPDENLSIDKAWEELVEEAFKTDDVKSDVSDQKTIPTVGENWGNLQKPLTKKQKRELEKDRAKRRKRRKAQKKKSNQNDDGSCLRVFVGLLLVIASLVFAVYGMVVKMNLPQIVYYGIIASGVGVGVGFIMGSDGEKEDIGIVIFISVLGALVSAGVVFVIKLLISFISGFFAAL